MSFTPAGIMAKFAKMKELDPADLASITESSRETVRRLELMRDALQGTLSSRAREVVANRLSDIVGPGQWQGLEWRTLDFALARILCELMEPIISDHGETYAAALMARGAAEE